MAKQPLSDDTAQSQEADAESQKKKPFLTTNLLIVLLLFVVAMSEMLVAWFFILPSPATVRASIEETTKQDIQTKTPLKLQIDETMQEEEREEVDLGDFTFTESDSTNIPIRLSIHLYGLINKKDREEYNKRYEIHKNRIRYAILVIIRSSKESEITDPSLGVIKNKVLVKVNEILGMPLVKGVIYTDIAVQAGG